MEEIVATTAPVETTTAPVETTTAVTEVRPEWLPEKFKTGNDLATSYKELETKLGGSFGAPDEYKWNGSGDEPDGVKLFKQVAKEQNLSQGSFDKMVGSYLEKESAILEVQSKQLEETRKTIGDDRISRLKNQLEGLNFAPEELVILDKFATGVNEFQLIENFVTKINSSLNAVNQMSQASIDPHKELLEIYNQPDFLYNAGKYSARVTELTKMKLERGTS